MAANLGDDADTTAAIYGQIAGAHYGVEAIPAEWRAQLTMAAEITAIADSLYDHARRSLESKRDDVKVARSRCPSSSGGRRSGQRMSP